MNLFQTGTNPTNLPLPFLGYSLLIILVCAAALIKVIRIWSKGRFTQGMRMIQVLLGLFLLRLSLFIFTYLAWQSAPEFTPMLQVIDQASALIGILLIVWLWNSSEPNRGVDLTSLGLVAVVILLVLAQLFYAPSLVSGFTGSMTFWQSISIAFLVIGAVLILIRKPNLWPYGLFMSAILLTGSILSLISGNLETMHLTQLVSYPLLLLLGDRFPVGSIKHDLDSVDDEDPSRRRVSVDIDILNLFQRLFDEKDPDGILYKIAQTTAYLILADLALVIDTPDEHGKIRIIAGYDLIREEPLKAITLDSKNIPLLSNYIQRGKMLHIPASSTSRDLLHLSRILQLGRPGHLLAAPIYVAGANKTIGVVLFSPFSHRPWTKEDQDYIALLCKLFEAAFSHHLISQDGESESVKGTIRDLSSKLTQLSEEKQDLKNNLAVLSKDHQNLLLEQDTLSAQLTKVQTWGNGLQRHLAMLVDLSKKESTEALRKYITVIEKEVTDLQHEDLQAGDIKEEADASKPDRKEEIDPDSIRPAVLNQAIQDCLDASKGEADKKGLMFKLDNPENPPLLKMNHALFKEIFSFLVANAIEDSEEKSEILIRTQIYEEDRSQHFAHIKISNTGAGYPPEVLADVLNDHLTTEQQEDLSQVMINLYVTKNLVENEGGRMWVDSKPDEGTTVSLLLAFL